MLSECHPERRCVRHADAPESKTYPPFAGGMLYARNDATLGGFRQVRTQAEGESTRRPASRRPIQQLTGQVSSQENLCLVTILSGCEINNFAGQSQSGCVATFRAAGW